MLAVLAASAVRQIDWLALVSAVLEIHARPRGAQMYTYVDFGDPIDDFCEANSLSFGMDVQRLAGGAPHRAQGVKVLFSTKDVELHHDFFMAVTKQTKIASVTIEVWRTEKACTLMYNLKDVYIVSFRLGAASTQIIGLDFKSMTHRDFSIPPGEW